jgi:cell division septation protein DedD
MSTAQLTVLVLGLVFIAIAVAGRGTISLPGGGGFDLREQRSARLGIGVLGIIVAAGSFFLPEESSGPDQDKQEFIAQAERVCDLAAQRQSKTIAAQPIPADDSQVAAWLAAKASVTEQFVADWNNLPTPHDDETVKQINDKLKEQLELIKRADEEAAAGNVQLARQLYDNSQAIGATRAGLLDAYGVGGSCA